MADKPAFVDNDYCFACGSRNPLGLQLTFYQENETLCTKVLAAPHWQGFSGVIHGGLQSTILDDLMSNYLIRVAKVWATTAELTCRFKRPVPIGQPLVFKAVLRRHKGRIWEIDGFCRIATEPDSAKLTTALGRFLEVPKPDSC